MTLKYNFLKTLIGFILGTILLYRIIHYNFIVISIIQMIFFTFLYWIIDKIKDCLTKRKKNKTIPKTPK